MPGPNRPIARLSANPLSLTARLDASASTDPDGAAGSLSVRFDLGNDGTFESIWLPQTQAYDWLLAQPGGYGPVGIEVRDADGLVGATQRRARVSGFLSLTSPSGSYSASAGGPLHLDLDVGPGGAGLTYAVLGGVSGWSPGLPLAPGLTVPVNYDGVSAALLSLMNSPLFVNAFSTLDGNGRARATLNMPPGVLSPLVTRTFAWGAFGMDVSPRFVTNGWSTTILP